MVLIEPEIHAMAVTMEKQIPLCVDLDGTLVRTDLFYESFFAMLKLNALLALKCVVWLFKGKAHVKHQMAKRVAIHPERLPYQKGFLQFLRDQRAQDRSLVLCTASHEKYASQIAAHLELFDKVIASDAQINMGGKNKRALLVSQYGEGGFDYAGNSAADLEIWPYARNAILVNPTPRVERAMKRAARIENIFKDKAPGWRDYRQLFRLHQWFKNVLLFVPVVAAHRMNDVDVLADAFMAFVAFSLCASSVYILNDLLDLDLDRKHPRKRGRSLAKGVFPIDVATMFVPTLLLAALALSLALPYEFLGVLVLYFLATMTYSLWLKKKMMLDVLLLAGLYTLRIIAGSAATSISPSFWLLAFSMFLFLSLAQLKRYSELIGILGSDEKFIPGRAYQHADLTSLYSLGTSSGYLSVLVLALYVNSDDVSTHYAHPEWIWVLCPLLLYWISRVWIIAGRGGMHDDPLVFAFRDRPSQWVGMVAAIIVWLAD